MRPRKSRSNLKKSVQLSNCSKRFLIVFSNFFCGVCQYFGVRTGTVVRNRTISAGSYQPMMAAMLAALFQGVANSLTGNEYV